MGGLIGFEARAASQLKGYWRECLADTKAAEKFPEELKKIIIAGGYSRKQVFNCNLLVEKVATQNMYFNRRKAG